MTEANESRIRLLLADDHAFCRRGLRVLLSTWPEVELVAEAEDGCEALELVEATQPDVVLMDLQMPVCDGLEAIRCIKHRWPHVRVIALTVHGSSRAAARAAGADCFLLKGCRLEDLSAAIHRRGDLPGDRQIVRPTSTTGLSERRPGPLLRPGAAAV
jgi:DNA-binding NarL/FixJ family response regulator